MKKIYLLITIILLTFISFIIIVLKPRNYTLKYLINNLNITENYIKNEGYLFTINYKDIDYPIFIEHNYSHKRKFIENITIYELNDEICLNTKVFNNNYYICSNSKELKTLNTMSKEFLEKYDFKNYDNKIINKYQNINIFNNDFNYLIWNYKGFYQLNKNNNSTLISFNKDNYQNNLSYQTEKYLIFPDYNSEYYFNKLYIYDIQNSKLSELECEFEISYDSYYLGDVSNQVYLVDKKNQNEYAINLKEKSVNKISKDGIGLIYEEKKWSEESITKIINNEKKFKLSKIYNYIIKDEKLYLNIKNYEILVTNNNVKHIIHTNDNQVFYLSKDKLYTYEYLNDNKLLLEYPEWNFNYNNHIFIFN